MNETEIRLGAVESKLSAVENEMKNCNKMLEESRKMMQVDHDLLIKMSQRLDIYCNSFDEVRKDRKQDKNESAKTFVGRVWQVLSLLLAAVIGGFVSAFFKGD